MVGVCDMWFNEKVGKVGLLKALKAEEWFLEKPYQQSGHSDIYMWNMHLRVQVTPQLHTSFQKQFTTHA